MSGFDPNIQESLLSAIFILLGSLAFNISALISGYNVYKEMAGLQSIALSLGAGIIVFFLSPVGFIFAFTRNPTGPALYESFFDFNVLIPFFCASLGLGLIFGSLVTLEARENILLWFRDRSGIRYWINSYDIIWDFFFRRVRRGGEITVKTKSGESLDCSLEYYSMRKVPREIVIKSCEGGEGHMLIRGSDIESVKVPPHSFMKHHGLITPIGQAFYTAIVCLGLLCLSFSAGQTGTYIYSRPGFDTVGDYNVSLNLNETGTYIFISGLDFIVASNISLDVNETRTNCSTSDVDASKSFLSSNKTGTNISISGLNLSAAFNSSLKANETGTYHVILNRDRGNLSTFYEEIQKYLFYISIILLLLLSMWLSSRDYSTWKAWFSISSDSWFMFLVLSIYIYYYFIYFNTTPFEKYFTKILIIVWLLLAMRMAIYFWIVRYINGNILNELEEESIEYESLNRVIRTFYTYLCRDFPYESRSHLENVRDEAYNRLPVEDRALAESFIRKVNQLKHKFDLFKLRDEDFRLLCILLTRLNYPIFSPILHGRYKSNLKESIENALEEVDPAKKATMFLNIASNIPVSNFNGNSLKKRDGKIAESDKLDILLKNYKNSYGEDKKWAALKATLSLESLSYIARDDLHKNAKNACDEANIHNLDEINNYLQGKSTDKSILWKALNTPEPSFKAEFLAYVAVDMPYLIKDGLKEDLKIKAKQEADKIKNEDLKNKINSNLNPPCWGNIKKILENNKDDFNGNIKSILWAVVAQNLSKRKEKQDAWARAFEAVPENAGDLLKNMSRGEIWRMAFEAAMNIKYDSQKAEVLSNIVSKDDVWRMAFEEAMSLPKEKRLEILSEIVNIDGLRILALMSADAIDDPITRARIMIQAASNLPSPLRENELERALLRLIGEEEQANDDKRYLKFKTLIEIAPKLPDNLREKAIAAALESASSIEKIYYRSKAHVEIAPLLPDPLKEELLKQARETIRGTDSNHIEMNIKYTG